VLAAAPVVPALFTSDPAVRAALVGALVVVALQQPLSGLVFVLDGVLIGAGDGTYLAWGGLATLAVFAPAALAAVALGGGLLAVWVSFTVAFMGARLVVLTLRARGTAWLHTGASFAAR